MITLHAAGYLYCTPSDFPVCACYQLPCYWIFVFQYHLRGKVWRWTAADLPDRGNMMIRVWGWLYTLCPSFFAHCIFICLINCIFLLGRFWASSMFPTGALPKPTGDRKVLVLVETLNYFAGCWGRKKYFHLRHFFPWMLRKIKIFCWCW